MHSIIHKFKQHGLHLKPKAAQRLLEIVQQYGNASLDQLLARADKTKSIIDVEDIESWIHTKQEDVVFYRDAFDEWV